MPRLPIDMHITDIIRRRKSWRTYADKSIENEKKEQILNFISTLNKPPFASEARFQVVDLDLNITRKVSGTYGVIKGAKTFVASIVKKSPRDMEDVGFLFEQIILFATGINLDTCWMGASFSRSLFSEKLSLQPDELIPVVSPVGYKAGRRSLTDAVFHMTAGSKNRKPWSDLFFNRTLNSPLDPKDAGRLEIPFEMVRLAPSAVNKQPWRLILDENAVHFFLKRTPGFESMFTMDLQRIDMGIAMCHFELAANEAGIDGRWKIDKSNISPISNEVEYVVSWIY
jgi:nitroreductase